VVKTVEEGMLEMSKYKNNIKSNLFTQIMSMVFGFITSILIARQLGPTVKGQVAYLMLIFRLLSEYGHLGINNATMYFQKKSKYSESEVYNTNMSYSLFIILSYSIIILFLRFNNIILQDYTYLQVSFGIAFMFFTVFNTIVRNMYTGNERIVEYNKYEITSKIIYFTSVIILYFAGMIDIYTYLISLVAVLIIKVIFSIKNLGITFKLKFNNILLIEEFKYGSFVYFAALFNYLNYRADQFIIKYFSGSFDLGVYSIAIMLSELVLLIPISISSALTGRLYNIEDKSMTRNIIMQQTIKFNVYICGVIVLGGVIISPIIPIIYGIEYSDAINVSIILFIATIFASLGKLSGPYFLTKGNPKIIMKISLISLLINIMINLILIPIYGIIGAAISSLISYMIYGILFVIIYIRFEGFKFRNMFILNKEDIYMLKKLVKFKN
jgi:O-antigen/teichoic acid export membrane protein